MEKTKTGEENAVGLKGLLFYTLKPSGSDGLLSAQQGISERVGESYLIMVDAALHEVSLHQQGLLRRFIYIQDAQSYEDYKTHWVTHNSPHDQGRISEVYKSIDELIDDLNRHQVKKSFVEEIMQTGHVSFPYGQRC
ncbi:hypothetical protein HZB02_01095 [Candidatus Woesearchaeota archaeon]|nr:hypothetical protein [Candidatus Woesearchaeota archaeon]